MTRTSPAAAGLRDRLRLTLPAGTLVGLGVAVFAVGLIAFLTYRSLQFREVAANRVTQALEAIHALETLLSSVRTAETAQRGFLLTGDEVYAQPFDVAVAAVPGEIAAARGTLPDRPDQLRRLDQLERVVGEKFTELRRTMTLQRAGERAAALAMVRTDRGQAVMERVHELVAEMEREERLLLVARQDEWQEAVGLSSLATWGGSAMLVFLIGLAGVVMARHHRAREIESWLRSGQMELASAVQGEQRVEVLGDNVMTFLANYLDAQAGAVHVRESGRFKRIAAYALAPGAPDDGLRPGDGLVGQAVKENRALHVTDVPDGYLPVASTLGRGTAPSCSSRRRASTAWCRRSSSSASSAR